MEALVARKARSLISSSLALVLAVTSLAPTAWADAKLQTKLADYIRAQQNQDFYGTEEANQAIQEIVFSQSKDWNSRSLDQYIAKLREIDTTLTPQFPEYSAELSAALQNEWERQVLTESVDERYHTDSAQSYERRKNIQLVASSALTILLPAMWGTRALQGAKVIQNSASLSRLVWQTLGHVVTGATVVSGGSLIAASQLGKTLAPPSPAEIMSLAVRNAQDLRWSEGIHALDADFLADLYGAENALLLQFTLSRIGGGAALPLLTEGVSTLGTIGIHGLVIASIGSTYYFSKKIAQDKWSRQRDIDLQKAMLNARTEALAPHPSTQSRLASISKYIAAVQRLEAFWLRDELIKEALLRISKQGSPQEQENIQKLAEEISELTRIRYEESDSLPSTLADLGLLLRWPQIQAATQSGPEALSRMEAPKEAVGLARTYLERNNLSRDLFKKTMPGDFTQFIGTEFSALLTRLASPLRDETAMSALLGVHDVIALLGAVGAELSMSEHPWIRARGADILLRAQEHRAQRALFMGEEL